MKDMPIEYPESAPVNELELAQIRTLVLMHERHQETVSKILASRGVSQLEELDGLSLKNLLQYLLWS
jgi:hypothetical protein